MSTTKKSNTKVLVECALLIAIATVLNVVCSFIPFLNCLLYTSPSPRDA